MVKNNFLEGMKFSLGILFIFGILGVVYAVGFHPANEILSGDFNGNYSFTGSLNLTNTNISGLSSRTWKFNSKSKDITYVNIYNKEIQIVVSVQACSSTAYASLKIDNIVVSSVGKSGANGDKYSITANIPEGSTYGVFTTSGTICLLNFNELY